MITIFSLFLCMDDHHLRWITKFPKESLHGLVFEKWRHISFPSHNLLMHGVYVVLTSVGLIHRVCPGMNSNTCTMVGWTLTLPIEPYLAHAVVLWQATNIDIYTQSFLLESEFNSYFGYNFYLCSSVYRVLEFRV